MTKSTKIVAALGVVAGLGIAALPLGTFAATTPFVTSPATKDVTVQLTVSSAVGIASDKTTCSATALPNATATCANVISYGTNASAGATLSVKDKDSTLTLTSGTNTIPAADGAISAGTAKWNISGGNLTNKAIKTTDQTVATASGPVDTSVTMTYNFATAADQAQGTYTDIITYTITAQ